MPVIVERVGRRDGAEVFVMALNGKPAQGPPCPATSARPVPVGDWPKWAVRLSRLQRDYDAGVGDTAKRIFRFFGGEWFKRFAKKLGIPCGCDTRQADWNAKYPYGS